MEIRPYEPRDAEAVVAMFNRIAQEPETADSLRDRFAKFPPSLPSLRMVAESPDESGDPRVIGYANAVASGPEGDWSFLTRVHVGQAHQGQGIGRTLLERVEPFAWEHGAKRLMTQVRDDMERELRFAVSAGFREEQHLVGVVLNLTAWDRRIHPAPPANVEIASFATLGDAPGNRRKLFDLYYETDADTPGIEMWGQDGFDEWSNIFSANWFRPEGCLIAVAPAGDWVGMNLIGPKNESDYTTDFTGVKRAWRGKGIAKALKVAGIEWAQTQGALRIHTFNDDRNLPMRAINDGLGFARVSGWRSMMKMGG